MALSLAFACPSCGAAVEGPLEETTDAMTCAKCGATTALPEAPALAASRRADRCPVCGSTDVYQQSDFNRALGVGLVAVGVLTGPFTRWISTVGFIVFDAVLYMLVPPVAVCYACEAQQRGFGAKEGPPKFDIAVHDLYRFGKRFPPRRDAAVAGPHARLLAREGKAAAR